MNKPGLARGKIRQQNNKAQLLLDGLILYRSELGELGKQLERLLRQNGVRSNLDPVLPAGALYYH